MDNLVILYVVFCVIVSFFAGICTSNRELKDSVKYTVREVVEIKDKCEVDLPRNKQCVLVFEVESE